MFNVGQHMMTLYAEEISTTMNLVITILKLGSSLNMTYRLIVPKGEIESLVNPINEKAIGVRLLVENMSF